MEGLNVRVRVSARVSHVDEYLVACTVENHRHAVTIDILPDNVFVDIFDFCLFQSKWDPSQRTKQWQILVHICQRWRSIIFASARRLDLYLTCSYRTRLEKNLAYWPVTFPLAIHYTRRHRTPEDDGALAVLEHSDRIHHIKVRGTDSLLAKVMQKPFPTLLHVDIEWDCNGKAVPPLESIPVIPWTFLGQSASRLQYLCLSNLSFPHLPALLLSARNLVTLKLENIFQGGYAYLSPKAMAGGLAMLPSLTTLSIELHYDTPPANQGSSRQDPPIRAILPSLTVFYYMGFSEYLEEFLSQIDTPRVDHVEIEYYAQELRALQLSRFIDRTENLKFDQCRRTKAVFLPESFSVVFDFSQGGAHRVQLSLTMHQAWRALFLGQLTATFSNVDHLSVHGDQFGLDEMDSTEWLPFLRQFPAVKALRLSGGVAAYITSALEHTADSVTDLLPALYLIWLDDEENGDDEVPVGSMETFLSVRQLSGRPVTIVDTYNEFVEADRNPFLSSVV